MPPSPQQQLDRRARRLAVLRHAEEVTDAEEFYRLLDGQTPYERLKQKTQPQV